MIIKSSDVHKYMEDNFEYLGDGCEAVVYRYDQNMVVKVYKNNDFKRKLDEETALGLMELDTKRILLPTEIIYDENNEMIGYKKEYKENYNHALKYISGITLYEEILKLKEEAYMLASNGYIISDLHRDNMIYDGKIYLTDPGSYEKLENKRINNFLYNQESLNGLIIDDIIGFELEQSLSKKKAKIITDDLHKESEFIGDVIKDELVKSKSLHSYTKSLAKRY